jgi:hypothetical protein
MIYSAFVDNHMHKCTQYKPLRSGTVTVSVIIKLAAFGVAYNDKKIISKNVWTLNSQLRVNHPCVFVQGM